MASKARLVNPHLKAKVRSRKWLASSTIKRVYSFGLKSSTIWYTSLVLWATESTLVIEVEEGFMCDCNNFLYSKIFSIYSIFPLIFVLTVFFSWGRSGRFFLIIHVLEHLKLATHLVFKFICLNNTCFFINKKKIEE